MTDGKALAEPAVINQMSNHMNYDHAVEGGRPNLGPNMLCMVVPL